MTSDHLSSSQDEYSPRGRRRPTRHNEDDLSDMKFDPPDFKGTLNPDVHLEWIQTVERFIEVKGYSDGNSFKIACLSSKSILPIGMKTPKGNK